MDWKTESDNEEFNEKPYSALSADDPDRFMSQRKYPRILLGLGVVLLIGLAIVFFSGNTKQPGKNIPNMKANQDITEHLNRLEAKMNEVVGVQQQLDKLENRIVGIEENLRFINDGQIASNAGSVDQGQAKAKAAEVAESLTRRLDLIEKRVGRMEKEIAAYTAKSDQQTAGQSSQQMTVHVVKKGDTPYSIARKYNLKLSELLRANGLNKEGVIYPGQELKIPK